MLAFVLFSLLIVSTIAQPDPATYCTAFAAKCPTQFGKDFASAADCQAFAALYDLGFDGQTSNNTLGCREYHIGVAADDDSVHCAHAGLNGGGACGSYCENYCFTRFISTGTGCNEDITMEQCMARCAEFPSTDTGNSLPGEMSGTSGNNVQCRIYHAAAAFRLNDNVHCLHSTLEGGNVCGDYCENYCYFLENSCGGGDYFASNAECLRACDVMNVGLDTDTSGPSVTCRLYHIGVAVTTGDAVHCTHADFHSTDGVCGDDCDHLCEINSNLCTGADADGGYGGFENCKAICAALPAGTLADTAGNTVGCRNYHVDFAVQGGNADFESHCRHSGVAGDGVCGDWCDSYCAQSASVCPSAFESEGVCRTACLEFAGSDAASPYVYSADSANNMQCRLYHMGAASFDSASVHCPHASVSGGGVCIEQVVATTTEMVMTSSSQAVEETTGSSSSFFVVVVALAIAFI